MTPTSNSRPHKPFTMSLRPMGALGLRRMGALAAAALVLLSACGPESPPASTGTGNLSQLTLPSSKPATATPRPAGAGTPVMLPSGSPSASPSAPASILRISKVMAWEVRPKGQSGPISLLIGTVHAPFAAGYVLPDALKSRIKSAQAFYMEADISQVESLLEEVTQQAVDPKSNLPELLGETHWQLLQTRIKVLGLAIPAQVLPFFRPWYLNLNLSSSPLGKQIDPATVMDEVLRKQALADKVPVRYLETARDQFLAMQSVSDAEYLRLIKQNLDEGLEALNTDYVRVFSAYNQGEAAAFDALELEARQESAEYAEKLVSARNRKWLAQLVPQLKAQSSVAATGVLHLAGPDGLAKQLEAQGFEVSAKTY